MIPAIPIPPLWVITAIGGLAAGVYGTHTWYKAQRVEAIQEARVTERAGVSIANQADVRYADRLLLLEQTNEKNADAFRKAIHEKNRELANCRVDGAVVGLLDDAGVSDPARTTPGIRPPAARAAPAQDSTCDVELDKCRTNYLQVCRPNAAHVRGLQDFYDNLRQRYNRGR